MPDDPSALPFEVARHAQAKRLRRRRRNRRGDDASPLPDAVADADQTLPAQSASQRRGGGYEDRALALLVRAGLQPLGRNLRCRAGEIDLALRDGWTLVLVEVRARRDDRFGGAAASVGHAKQARLIRAAHVLAPRLIARFWAGRPAAVRFDVVAFEGETPFWLRHAFSLER
ncbi:YraN family protein [Bordetella genomosp. 9]|uniref:UPF0102 protein CAL13_01055 n=1 Tax=Bordetella genomosp. 9 TaxID=1416803 RepID=A0A1W6YVG1_9BORD|nr:YraN family protein [Bordetella genomosp. 9]ARP84968.1 hypothetical protein CAL13_01055 [Bordetella genomosp. 9]